MEEKAKLAELVAEAEFLERRQMAENEAEKLRIQERLAKAKARSQVYEEMEEEKSVASNINEKYQYQYKTIPEINRQGEKDDQSKLKPRFLKEIPPTAENYRSREIKEKERNEPLTSMNESSSIEITRLMCNLLRHQSAPEVTLETFRGDPLEYHYFMSTFQEVVEQKIDDSHGRLIRLIKFTEGEAREIIRHCIQQPADIGYQMAKTLLKRHYGNPHRIMAAYRKEIKSWPPLKPGDANGYQKFYNFLIKCDCIISHQQWNALDTPDILCMLISKLPGHTRDRWNRKVLTLRNKDRREPELADFIGFVEEENILANDPLFSKEALQEYTGRQEGKTRRKIQSYASCSAEIETTQTKEKRCPMCKQHHDLDDCSLFMNKPVEERSKLLGRMKLCYGCYSPITLGHNARTCKNRRRCRICQSKHPTGLHGFVPRRKNEDETQSGKAESKDETSMKCNSIALSSKIISMCVVPVRVSHPSTKTVVSTFAMLDNCSQGTFMKDAVRKELGLEGRKTSITIRTLNGEENMNSMAITGLKIANDVEADEWVDLPTTYTKKELPADMEEVATREKIERWDHLSSIARSLPEESNIEIGLLIGANCAKALEPTKVIPSKNGGPFAFKTQLGWCVVGPLIKNGKSSTISCNRVMVEDAASGELSPHHFAHLEEMKESSAKEMLQQIYNADFTEQKLNFNRYGMLDIEEISLEDRKFLRIMEEGLEKVGKHYQLPLPMKNENIVLPNNRCVAEKRLACLKKRFAKDPNTYTNYKKFIDDLLVKGYARKASGPAKEGRLWYIPHHGVYHPNKPGKIRVVFDCSATFEGTSLNQNLISGPDLSNQIVGVIIRFREEPVAVMGDIEAMFHQVRIPERDKSLFRFLWWDKHDINGQITDYEMNVHVFGSTSSPSCCNYALKRTALDNKKNYTSEVVDTLLRNFYVDDLLKSVKDSSIAKSLIKDVINICADGGFKLTKFTSNDLGVLQSIPEADRLTGVKDVDLSKGLELSTEKALGINWNIKEDTLGFKIALKEKPMTRRGMLSMISQIYDPLGLASPFLLKGKRIIQELCKNNYDWDKKVAEEFIKEWNTWKGGLQSLEKIVMKRCYKPSDFGEIVHCSLHHFSDASQDGYGQVSYLRLVDKNGKIHCSLIMAKSRVPPKKYVSIPRMELTSATLSVKVARILRKELTIHPTIDEYFWTDSQVVLGYINNDAKRFKIYVANRVQLIRENSNIKNWKYVESKFNPADFASRGISPSNVDKVYHWINGPEFLWQPASNWASLKDFQKINENDPEIKKSMAVNTITVEDNIILKLQDRISSWMKLLKVMVYVLRVVKRSNKNQEITVQELKNAELEIIKNCQTIEFNETLKVLDHDNGKMEKNIAGLNPFKDQNGLIRVGGRLRNSTFHESVIHPILLPKKGQITNLIIKWCHEKTAHGGRNMTLNEIRSFGYWIIQGNSAVKSYIAKCVNCRRLRGKVGEQMMADLPSDRLKDQPPFTYIGVDMFGPFLIKEKRTLYKRYGALFTCLASRAIHIEMTKSLETDSFIMALRRFVARRGNVRSIRCDNGSNFMGAESELAKAVQEMDNGKIKEYLLSQGADWIQWKKNPPLASHMGGVWERQIRSARAVLSSLLKTHSQSLDDESLNTLFSEVEAIVNSRPLTVETINDVNSEVIISPSKLLTMKSKVVMPPPGEFGPPDIYSRRRWRRVQHISNEFWCRWRKEFLTTLQERQKWIKHRRNFATGDIVILQQDCHRNDWKMAKIIKVYPDTDGRVRSVQLYVGVSDSTSLCSRVLMRPISKITLLVESREDDVRSPTREPIDDRRF